MTRLDDAQQQYQDAMNHVRECQVALGDAIATLRIVHAEYDRAYLAAQADAVAKTAKSGV
jgi:exonuclease VII small subunit